MINSDIVLYRTQVVEAIRTTVTDFVEVDWYDAMFDDDDLRQWSVTAPCAFVAVRDVKGSAWTTGEVNLDLDVVVVIVTADADNRAIDAPAWSLMERVFLLANNNKFGNPNAAVPTGLKMFRMPDQELRSQGVALSAVEWHAGLTIGTNYPDLDYFYLDPATGQRIIDPPTSVEPGPTTIVQPPGRVTGPTLEQDFLATVFSSP